MNSRGLAKKSTNISKLSFQESRSTGVKVVHTVMFEQPDACT